MTHTTLIVLITVAISILAWQNNQIMARLLFDPISIQKFKQYDRFITHGFIHADVAHLLFNMFTLYSFGRVVENFYIQKLSAVFGAFIGNLGFVLFYVIAITVAITPSYLQNKHNHRYLSLGASGAVSAVLFAYILFYPWNLLYFFGLLPIPAIIFAIIYTAYSIYANRQGTGNINHLAHLYGAAFGVIFTILMEPMLLVHFARRLLQPLF